MWRVGKVNGSWWIIFSSHFNFSKTYTYVSPATGFSSLRPEIEWEERNSTLFFFLSFVQCACKRYAISNWFLLFLLMLNGKPFVNWFVWSNDRSLGAWLMFSLSLSVNTTRISPHLWPPKITAVVFPMHAVSCMLIDVWSTQKCDSKKQQQHQKTEKNLINWNNWPLFDFVYKMFI